MVVQQNKLDSQVAANAIATYLKAYLETGYFMGTVLVAREGEVLLSNGYGLANLEHNIAHTPQTKFRLGSITKQFTATAILQLQEQGLLQVDAPISTYLPNYPNGEQITVHHLLNHTAGIPSYTSFPDYPQKWRTVMSVDELIAWFSDKPLEFTPGDRHNYSNSGYAVLTKIIETVSSQSYADYLQHHIFQPLEMTNSGYDIYEKILPNRASGYTFFGDYYQNAAFLEM
ncbi:MAG TPA: serine hydrolase, partial [Cyanobacteria bacterium UBA8553]|nr:serine hydrolase [Cyanobacteria bacterium UBA8553]